MNAFDRWLLRVADALLGGTQKASKALAARTNGYVLAPDLATPYELPTALTDRGRMLISCVPDKHRPARAKRMGADLLCAEAVFGVDDTDSVQDYMDAAYGAPLAVSGAEFIPAAIQN